MSDLAQTTDDTRPIDDPECIFTAKEMAEFMGAVHAQDFETIEYYRTLGEQRGEVHHRAYILQGRWDYCKFALAALAVSVFHHLIQWLGY